MLTLDRKFIELSLYISELSVSLPNMPTKPLRLYKDISPGSSRLRNPGDDSPRVLIVGGGVTGLVTAWTLLDAGYHVTILAKEWATWTTAQRLTSQIAGALWEFPPAVCGKHTDKISLHYSKRWAMISYHIWRLLAEENIPGVAMKLAGFFFARPIEEDPEQLRKMKEIMSAGVEGFRRDASLVEHRRVDASYAGGVTDAYEFLSPVIDTDVAMEWLMQLVEAKGGNFVTEELDTDLLLLEESLRSRFGVDVIVNCTGLGSTTLAGDDSCYPLRGACIRIINDGKDFPKVESALCITADAAVDNEIVFIVPRSNNILYLGGMLFSFVSATVLQSDRL